MPGEQYKLKIALWDNRFFSSNPLTIEYSSAGSLQTGGIGAGQPAIWPRVIQDRLMDTVTVNLNRSLIGQRYRLDVSTYSISSDGLADEIRDIRSDSAPPVSRAPLLIAFWDAFPAATPAQALRRWDGAHTGPLGDRHGLFHILDGAWKNGVPVALLDIKNPASLAALDFMGNVSELRDLYARNLLILPDVAYGEPADVALDFSRRAAAGFDLPDSQFVYAVSPEPSVLTALPSGYRARFLHLADTAHLASFGGTRLIPLPPADAVQASEDGPSLDVRSALFKTAISPDPSDLVVLGGDLPHSTWGDSDMAYPTFQWIAAHPWIQPLTGQDLLTFPARTQPFVSTPAANIPPWLEELRSAPVNDVSESAWQTYLSLTAPFADTRMEALGRDYLGQVGELLAAAQWAHNPATRIDCKDDLNGDGHAECIMANRNYFAVLESGGARLTQLFYLTENGPYQVVGPSSQFTVGLSDPSFWHPERGEAADPSVISGAFADTTGTWMDFSSTINADGVAFATPDGSRLKIYRLTENGIQVLYQTNSPVGTLVPFALDPHAFFPDPSVIFRFLMPIRGPGVYRVGSVSRSARMQISQQRLLPPQFRSFPRLKIPTGNIQGEIIYPSRCLWLPYRAMGRFNVQISCR